MHPNKKAKPPVYRKELITSSNWLRFFGALLKAASANKLSWVPCNLSRKDSCSLIYQGYETTLLGVPITLVKSPTSYYFVVRIGVNQEADMFVSAHGHSNDENSIIQPSQLDSPEKLVWKEVYWKRVMKLWRTLEAAHPLEELIVALNKLTA